MSQLIADIVSRTGASIFGLFLLFATTLSLLRTVVIPRSLRSVIADAVARVIIGAAFATITTSLTDDIIMPIVGAIFGGLDFSNYFTLLGPIPDTFNGNPASYEDLKKAGVAVMGWGQFITVLINFLILAWIIFLLVKGVNALRASVEKNEEKAAEAAPPPADILC